MNEIDPRLARAFIYHSGYLAGRAHMEGSAEALPAVLRITALSDAWHSFKRDYTALCDEAPIVEEYTRGFVGAVERVLEVWAEADEA